MGITDRFILHRNESVLVVVDIQERLASVMSEKQHVIDNTSLLIEAAKLLGVPIVLTEQYPRGLGPTEKELTDIMPDDVKPLEKLHFSCCGEPSFLDELKKIGRNKVILCGMETHICVLQTALGLIAEGYGVHFVSDAICSRKKSNFKVGIGMAREAGAVITSTETVLFQLLEKAGTDEFKKISKMVK